MAANAGYNRTIRRRLGNGRRRYNCRNSRATGRSAAALL